MKLQSEDFHSLVEYLNTKYNTETEIIEYLINLDKMLDSTRFQPLIIDCWIRINQDRFFSIRENALLWKKVPARFSNTINSTIADLETKFIAELAKEVISGLPSTDIEKLENFLRLVGVHNIDEALLSPWVSEIVNKGNSDVRTVLVDYLSFIFERKKDFNSITKISMLVISKEKMLNDKLTQNLVTSTINALDQHQDQVEQNLLNAFKKEVIQKLEESLILDFYKQELLRFSVSNMDNAIEFLNNRILKFKDSEDGNCEIIPFKGIKCITDLINSYDDYEKLLNRLIFLSLDTDSIKVEYDIKNFINSIKNVKNDISGKLYIEEYIEKLVDIGDIDKAIFVSCYLPFEEDKFDLLIRVANKAIESGKRKNVIRLLDNYCSLEDGWASLPGEPSPEILLRKEMFLKISEKVKPGILRSIITDCIRNIDRGIEQDLKIDEEFLNPKI